MKLQSWTKKSATPDAKRTPVGISNRPQEIMYLRILVSVSLIVTMACFGTASYLLLSNAETQIYEEQYNSIVMQIFDVAQKTVLDIQEAGEELAVIASLTCPTIDKWPNCSILGYQSLTYRLHEMTGLAVAGHLPIVTPETLSGFEAFIKENFENDPSVSNNSFGIGVYALNETGKYHDTTGVASFSDRRIMTPLANIYPIESQERGLLFNTHSESIRGKTIDKVLDCAETKGVSKSKDFIGNCAANTDILQFVTGFNEPLQPSTLTYFPIYPYSNTSRVTGLVAVGYTWLKILEDAVPSYVSGLHCVIYTEKDAFTYDILYGTPRLLGPGRQLTGVERNYRRTSQFHYSHNYETAEGSVEYFIEIHPNHEFYEQYHSKTPIYACVGSVLIIVLTSIIFIAYDRRVNAEAASKNEILNAKRRFVRYISHEIRTPLNTVVLGLKLMDITARQKCQPQFLLAKNSVNSEMTASKHNATLDAFGTEYEPHSRISELRTELLSITKDVQESSEAAVAVLNDLLQYDKVESGSLNIEVAPIRPWNLIQKCVSMFEIQAQHAQLDLKLFMDYDANATSCCSDDSMPSGMRRKMCELAVMGDQVRIMQVLRNLISNALKFSPEHGVVKVVVTYSPSGLPVFTGKQSVFTKDSPRAGSILIAVHDMGAGISVENQARLFGEGVQFNANKLQGGQGSGLGLWITKAIVELHGGRIWCVSDGEDRGSNFFVELPVFSHKLTKAEQIELDSLSQSSEFGESDVEELVTANLGKILVVDDVKISRKVLARLLEVRGFEVVQADDGIECTEIMATEEGSKIFCVLMDYQMVKMNGPEAAEVLRQRGYEGVIVGVTGNVMAEDRDYYLDKGANFVMGKPFEIETFYRDMRVFLRSKRSSSMPVLVDENRVSRSGNSTPRRKPQSANSPNNHTVYIAPNVNANTTEESVGTSLEDNVSRNPSSHGTTGEGNEFTDHDSLSLAISISHITPEEHGMHKV